MLVVGCWLLLVVRCWLFVHGLTFASGLLGHNQWHGPNCQMSSAELCVVFNPAAKGERAKGSCCHLDEFGSRCALKLTAAAGEARGLAAEAVEEGFLTVVAAGGDGTVNEVLNGIGDARDGFRRARLGVLPLGTVNVFARELTIPTRLRQAWQSLLAGRETLIDLPKVEFGVTGQTQSRYFAQLAGAGLDARAVELVHWPLKKRIGPLAYVWAGMTALCHTPSQITLNCSKPSLRRDNSY